VVRTFFSAKYQSFVQLGPVQRGFITTHENSSKLKTTSINNMTGKASLNLAKFLSLREIGVMNF
jgi:hypothetical protein